MDGLFVSSLFTNGWIGNWRARGEAGHEINDMDSGGEGFWPTMVKTADGNVYFQAINHTSSIVRVDGLASVKRLPYVQVTVTPQMLTECGEYFLWADRNRIARQGRKKLTVAILRQPPAVDGKLDAWSGADWAAIDSMTYAAAAIAGERLYVAFKTAHPKLIENAGGSPWQALFKSGGGLDIMLAADPEAEKSGKRPAPGDQRLLTAKVNGAHRSILYRPVAQGEKRPASFSSPWRTIEFDQVVDVSKDVEFAEGKGTVTVREPNAFGATSRPSAATTYEISVPLSLLGLKAKPGMRLRGDLGVLIGNGSATEQRLYWSNKATTVVVDVPTEAMLSPELWGDWTIEPAADLKEEFRRHKVELRWMPLGDGRGEVSLLVGNSSKGAWPLGVVESAPDGFVLSPGYRLNYASFEVRTVDAGQPKKDEMSLAPCTQPSLARYSNAQASEAELLPQLLVSAFAETIVHGAGSHNLCQKWRHELGNR